MHRESLTLLLLVLVMVASLMLASCGSPNGATGPTGTLTGTLQAVGGPTGASPLPLRGEVTLHRSNGSKGFITVSASGRFSLPVTVGTYTLTAQSPQFEGGSGECHASGRVVVIKDVKSSVVIDCQEK